jgi:hypothetical protein
MYFKRIYPALLLVYLVLGACRSALYFPKEEHSIRSGISVEELLKGRDLYVKSCGSCHNLFIPNRFTKQHWINEMPEMQQKAKIGESEANSILNYIIEGINQEIYKKE